MAPSNKKPEYVANQRILCRHGPLFYDAKIVEAEPHRYLVHYQGWHKRHDEWVPLDQVPEKFQLYSEEALARAKQEEAAAKGQSKPKKKKLDHEEEKGKSGSSRGSTPSERQGGNAHANSTTSDRNVKGSRGMKRKASDATPTVLGSNAFVDAISDPTQVRGAFDMPLRLPLTLKQVLVDDYDMVNRQGKICTLPARITIEQIIDEYCAENGQSSIGDIGDLIIEYEAHMATVTPTQLVQSSLGLKDYFDVLLGFQLLYKAERPQYSSELEKARDEKEPPNKRKKKDVIPAIELTQPDQMAILRASKLYGLPHLLRLLSRLEQFFKLTQWSDRTVKVLSTTINDFIVYLNKNVEKYWDISTDYEVTSPEYVKMTHSN